MSTAGLCIKKGIYDAKELQNVYILEFHDDRLKVHDKVYKTKRGLINGLKRLRSQWGAIGVRARTVQGVRIVEAFRESVFCSPGAQSWSVRENFNGVVTDLSYHGEFFDRVEAVDRPTVQTDEELTLLVRSVGLGYGFTDVEAQFYPFPEFKVNWMRQNAWISLNVTDFLKGADTGVLRDTIVSIFERMQYNGPSAEYSDRMRAEFRTWRTREDLKGLFISRNKLELRDSGLVREAMRMGGVEGYTETWYTPYEDVEDPEPRISAILGIVALPRGHEVNLPTLAYRLKAGDRKLLGA